jgi:putative transposase
VDYARKKFAPVGNGLNLTRPLERVEIDEYRADAMTLMTAAGLDRYLSPKELADLGLDGKNKRWLITVAICATTRCIVGMSITRDAAGTAEIHRKRATESPLEQCFGCWSCPHTENYVSKTKDKNTAT